MTETTQQQTETSVRKSVTVAASQERAFAVFTEGHGTWWPKEHHIGPSEMATATVEPKVGGRWYETGVDGSECEWGRVLVWEPPNRVVTSWHIQADWNYDPDPARGSEVEVRFIAEGPEKTRVELEHRHFERHGAGAATVAETVSNQHGWGYVLGHYLTVVEQG